MGSIKDKSEGYTPPTTLNVSELKRISVDVEIFEKTGQKKDGEVFSYNAIEINKQEYRVPISVLKQLKEQLKENPKMKYFKVNKSGSGFDTTYIVIPLKD